jgi:hypothetical protein
LGTQKLDKSIALVDVYIYWIIGTFDCWGIVVELLEEFCWTSTTGTCGGGLTTGTFLDKYNLTLPSGITSVT